jgi:hypothetical protein
MKKRVFLGIIITIAVVLGSWYYYKINDDTYEGMSIIPEEHDDIPLYEGLEPRRNDYIIEGNHWHEIYQFYLNEFPKQGWKLEYKRSALDDDDSDNDWSGFTSRWTKPDFQGELSLFANYNQHENITEVNFDHHIPPKRTPWISRSPVTLCVYDDPQEEVCAVIKDQNVIENIIQFIDEAAYDVKDLEQQERYGIIAFVNEKSEHYFSVNVHYSKDSHILYLQSEKGVKIMKPESEFFEMTNLRNLKE